MYELNTYYDVLELLKKFNVYIYLGKKLYDIELAAQETKQLFESNLIDTDTYLKATVILKREHRLQLSEGDVAEKLVEGRLL
jgi:uncharacterized protein YqgQ